MDIISVAAPRRRRHKKQEAGLADQVEQMLVVPVTEEGDAPPIAVGPAEDDIFDDAAGEETQPTPPPSRDIGNWEYREWKGKSMWYNIRTHRTSFDDRYVRKHRHE